jgi:hypothetical protein
MKRNIEEVDEMENLCNLILKSNVYNEEDEYRLLLEGANCEYNTTEIIKIAKLRYERYLAHLYFEPKLKYIERMINKFIKEDSDFDLMKLIDNSIINYIENHSE